MNEYCQIVAQWLVQTKSWIEVELGLQQLKQRYADLGVEVYMRSQVRPSAKCQACPCEPVEGIHVIYAVSKDYVCG